MVLGLSLALVAVVKADDKVPSHQPNDFTQIHLLQNSSVQKELKLSDALANKLREMFAENQEEIKEVWQKYPPDEAGTHWQGMTQELKKSALALLNDQQRHRLWQIDFQQSTSFGFDSSTYARPDIAKVLEWTDEQKTKLQEIQTDTANKNKEAIKTPQQYQQKIAEIRKQDREQVAALLTKEQQQKWQDFVGERFTITNPQVDLQSALSKWIRDDFSAAQARSRKTGKPILAVFRCEP
jgi:hypothetical protein